jgi:hypothetical protein
LPLVLEPSTAGESPGDVVVVGVPADRERAGATAAARAAQAGVRAAFPQRPSLAIVLSSDPADTVEPSAVPSAGVGEPPVVHAATGGREGSLRALLDVALSLGASACALLEPMPRPEDPGWLRALLDPVLDGAADVVAPSYARGRFEGVLVTGIVYPLTRALFGQRLRQPLAREIVLSRRLVEHLSLDEEWRSDPVYAGADLWVITKALVRECRCAQVFLGPRPVPQPQPADVSDALARVLGSVFHEMTRHAAHWQRIRGSSPVATFGDEYLPGPPGAAPQPAPMASAFTLGWQGLRGLWSQVLPPNTLYALQRIAREPPGALRFPDALWAHIVYDFAVAWRVKAMDRLQLLRSMTPLYFGWVASFVNEVATLDATAAEERVERLCLAFEAEKPYLIVRWRWPDRFAP